MSEPKLSETSVYLSHSDDKIREQLAKDLEELGLKLLGYSDTVERLRREGSLLMPDLIISGISFDDGESVDALIEISELKPTPAIIIAKSENLDEVKRALEDHVMAYLIAPVEKRDLESSAYLVLKRFAQIEELHDEVEKLQQTLELRKKLERAKGLVMKNFDMTEEEAYLKIREIATGKRMKMADVSELIIEKYKGK